VFKGQLSQLRERRHNMSLQNLLIPQAQAMQLVKPIFAKEYILDQKIVYNDNNHDGIWEAKIQAPLVSGEFILRTIIDYKDPQLKNKSIDTLTLIDPEGYVYTLIQGSQLRIKNAIVSLYVLDPETDKYILWDPKDTNQPNPQITDQTGQYSYLVSEGKYYLKVQAESYKTFKSAPFKVVEQNGVRHNIELKPKIKILNYFLDIKILIGMFLVLVLAIINILIKILKKRL